MEKNFWAQLDTPFFCLAPMYDVTDAAFRRIICKYSSPDVVFTEFVSADGLVHPIGFEKLKHHLWFDESERPIVAQLFGATPDNFEKAARIIVEMGFDGIDINMGCPEKNVQKQKAGAALITTPELAQDVIRATQKGAGTLPVSVKTRIGYDEESIDEWISALLACDLPALIVHLRTKKEMSDVPARWELMEQVVALRDEYVKGGSVKTLIIGNGDVETIDDGRRKMQDSGCDGVMIGRGVFGDPWLFADEKRAVSIEEKLHVMVEHTYLYEELFTGINNFAIMKKHYKAYATGFSEASTLRNELMQATNANDVEKAVITFLKDHNELL